MEKQLEIFNELYSVTNKWLDVKPWLKFKNSDWIKVSFSATEYYYCAIGGVLGNSLGLAVYQGEEGYSDLTALSNPAYKYAFEYLANDQDCLIFYMGNCENVPPAQKKIIEKLGLKYHGRNNWPLFFTLKKRFFLDQVTDEEAFILTKVMKQILIAIENNSHSIDQVHHLHTYFKDNTWHHTTIAPPIPKSKYVPFIITDEKILHDLVNCKTCEHSLTMELFYTGIPMQDDEYDRPINPLFFSVLLDDILIPIGNSLIRPEINIVEAASNTFINFILSNGRPREIKIRNPLLWSAYQDICDLCEIKITIDPLEMFDHITDELINQLD